MDSLGSYFLAGTEQVLEFAIIALPAEPAFRVQGAVEAAAGSVVAAALPDDCSGVTWIRTGYIGLYKTPPSLPI